jgi:membrane-associated protein
VAFIRDNLELIFILIVALSVIPIVLELARHKVRTRSRADATADEPGALEGSGSSGS